MPTTLEILAPYLPYDIEVKDDYGDNFRLRGLKAPFALFDVHSFLGKHVKCLSPVLRPFSQLVEPLDDGTIPVVEVAKLALSDKEASFKVESDSFYMIGKYRMRRSGIVAKAEYDDIGTTRVIIAERWRVSIEASDGIVGPPDCALAIYDYLRSKHFALPVNGRLLVEGVDYIAKPRA